MLAPIGLVVNIALKMSFLSVIQMIKTEKTCKLKFFSRISFLRVLAIILRFVVQTIFAIARHC